MGAPPLLPLPSAALSGLSRARPPSWRWPVALSARWPSARSRKVPPPGVRACCRPWPPWFAASASVARVLWRSVRLFSALAALGRRPGSRVLFPPGLRRRRPSRRRFAVRWRGRVPSGAWGGVGRLPRPLAVFPGVGLGGLAAGRALFCVPSAGCRPASRPVSRPRRASGRCRWRLFRRLVWRRLGWRVLAAAPAVFFSPLTTPLFSPWRWRAAMRSISVRGAKNSCAPVRPLADRLSCGRGPRLGCVRGRRAWAVVLPPLACALRLPRRVRPPAPSRGGRPRRLVGRVRR